MPNKKSPRFGVEKRLPWGQEPEITCRCGKEFNDLEALIVSLDDAGLTFYCDRCPENTHKFHPNPYDLPYV